MDRSMAQSAQCAEGLAELKASVASSERLLQQSREGLELRLAELKELSERRGGDLNGRLEALKAAGGEQGQQLEQLSAVSKGLSERLSEMRRGAQQDRRHGIVCHIHIGTIHRYILLYIMLYSSIKCYM